MKYIYTATLLLVFGCLSAQVKIDKPVQVIQEASYTFPNPGTSATGAINIRSNTNNRETGITFSQAGLDNAQAGIYVHQDNSAGTHMYLATTGSYSTGPQTRLTILNSGNVGIGTVIPGQKLEVNGNSIFHNGGTTYNNAGAAELHIGYAMAGSGSAGEVARLALQPYGHTGGPFLFVNRDDAGNAYLDLRYGSSNLITMQHSGRLGIGTTAPVSNLHLRGTQLSAFTGTARGQLSIDGAYTNGYYSAIDFLFNNDANPTARIASQSNSFGSKLMFGTSNSYASGITNTAMTIDHSGNVGVGTTAPEAKLHVTGKMNVDGVETISWQGSILGNQSVTHSFTHDAQSSVEITAVFNHYGYIASYGCARKALVANYSAGTLSVVDIANVTSGNGGSWSITRSGDAIYITKNAGSYAGGGYYFVTVTGTKNLVKQ